MGSHNNSRLSGKPSILGVCSSLVLHDFNHQLVIPWPKLVLIVTFEGGDSMRHVLF